MIHFDKVSKEYPNDKGKVLKNITLDIGEGEFVSIVGKSGAGKTTMIKMILGEVEPTKGKVHVDAVNVHELSSSEISLLRRQIGTVFQDFRLISDKTAYENVAFVMEASGKTDEEVHADVPHVLDLVNLGKKELHFPDQLSGGEQQRLAIARAIITQPKVILADEPTGNLDPDAALEVVEILKKINELGTTVVVTTHNKTVVNTVKKRVITLEDGTIVSDEEHGKFNL